MATRDFVHYSWSLLIRPTHESAETDAGLDTHFLSTTKGPQPMCRLRAFLVVYLDGFSYGRPVRQSMPALTSRLTI